MFRLMRLVATAFAGVLLASSVPPGWHLAASAYGGVVINEVLASNGGVAFDEDGDAEDWLELLNSTGETINLAGYSLTDDIVDPVQWPLPPVDIQPGGRLLVWASGKDRSGPELHTNFRISKSGETIALFDPMGFRADVIVIPAQLRDVSYGRTPDGGGTWAFFEEPTPGGPNDTPAFDGIAPRPVFSTIGGFYDAGVNIRLFCADEACEVRYTTDGSTPSETSDLYQQYVHVGQSTVVRARSFRDGWVPSETVTQSYFIGVDTNSAVISLVAEPDDLFGAERGIYSNWEGSGREWERPVSMEFFTEGGVPGFTKDAGIRVHGTGSRGDLKKSLRVYFRDAYGGEPLRFGAFPGRDYSEFHRLLLRAGSDDYLHESAEWVLFRDSLCNTLDAELGGITADTRIVRLYINAQPWGVYLLREYFNEDFFRVGLGMGQVDIIKEGELVEGTWDAWNSTVEFFEGADPNAQDFFGAASTLVDIDAMTAEYLTRIYAANTGLPDRLFVRERSPGATWRHVIYDCDSTFKLAEDETLHRAVSQEWYSDEMFIALIANPVYRRLFVTRFADALNSTLSTPEVLSRIESYVGGLSGEIPFEVGRWGSSVGRWETNVEAVREFARTRPGVLWEDIGEEFSDIVDGTCEIVVEAPEGGEGRVFVNSVELTAGDFPWHGRYFGDFPVVLRAVPEDGYKFAGWSEADWPQTVLTSGTIASGGQLHIHPIFTPGTAPGSVLWSFPAGDQVKTSPAIADDGTVFFGSDAGQLYALNADGTLKWRFPASGFLEAIRSSPAIGDDGAVFFGCRDGTVYAVEADGSLRWSFSEPFNDLGNVDAGVSIAADGTVYVGAQNGVFYALNSADGSVEWSYEVGGNIETAAAIAGDGTVFFGSDDGGLYALDSDGGLEWAFPTGDEVRSPPALGDDGAVYFGSDDGHLYAVAPDGSLLWAFNAGDEIQSPPTISSEGNIYFGCQDNRVYALGPGGGRLWSYLTGGDVEAAPCIGDDGVVYVTSKGGSLHALSPFSGDVAVLWTLEFGGADPNSVSSPVISDDGTVYAGSDNGRLWAIASSSGGPATGSWSVFGADRRHTGRMSGGEMVSLNVLNGTGSGLYSFGSEVTVEAVEPKGYIFDRWAGQVDGLVDVEQSVTTMYLESDATIVALFILFVPGDVNKDECVNVADLLLVRNSLGNSGSGIDPPGVDATGDGIVNVSDLLFVRDRLGNGCGEVDRR